MNQLTGLKDVDREVLKHISDKELLNVCYIDRRMWNQVCDDAFLRRRLLSKYPEIEKYKRDGETWKQFFLRSIYYTSKMTEEFQFTYTSGDFNIQYELLKKFKGVDLLIESARIGELSLIKYAISLGADTKEYEHLALREAAKSGHSEIVKYLIENDKQLNDKQLNYLVGTSYYVNLFDNIAAQALLHGDLELLKFLVHHGLELNDGYESLLEIPAEKGYIEIVKYLVEEHGANIHARDDRPIRVASRHGHLPVVKYLVEHGAHIRVRNDEALRLARHYGHTDVVNYLIEHGANPYIGI